MEASAELAPLWTCPLLISYFDTNIFELEVFHQG